MLKLLERIPSGKVTTYKEIARTLKNPGAARAAGNACSSNPHAPRVPCHRVITSAGFLGGYNNGIKQKIRLLKSEGVAVDKKKRVDLKQYLYLFEK